MLNKLGQVCDFYSGTGFPVVYQGKDNGELPFYKVGDIAANVTSGNTYLSFCSNFISRLEAAELRGTIIPQNTVVFAKIGEALKLNRRAITSCDCLIDNNAMGIAPKEDVLRVGYFFYFMKYLKMQDYAESTTVPSVRKSKLEQIGINVPYLDEQKTVEERLNLISDIILKREQELKRLDDLIKARFVEMFGDEKNLMAMSDICSIITDGTHQPPKFKENGIPFIFVSNVTGDKLTYDAEKFIDQDTYDELVKRTPIEIGDVLLSTVGSYGHPAVVKSDKKFLFQRHIAYLKPRREIVDSDYLHGAILSPEAQRQIEEGVKGIAQKTLNLSEIKKMRIPIPNMDKQKEFATFVTQVDKSKARVQKALDETQLLFDSLIQEYFG